MEKLSKFLPLLKKYRYALLVLAVGVVLMMLPSEKQTITTPQQTVSVQKTELSDRLEEVLSLIQGAGKVSVLLTPAAGEETVYQVNAKGDDLDTVTVTDSNRNESGLIRQINPPVYQGAIVICQGADRAAVRLAIVDAVSKITGLGADRISVLKMK